ncbi:MAG TPA: tRNA glutamyl-Q(34) synthetase GluQRS [Burkholderiales bacterium]
MKAPRDEHRSGYRGRFAPSPTGPLHFGSLVAAVGSFLQARASGGEWLVRMEDIDPPREMPGAAEEILRTLERYGLVWDGEVMYQSRRAGAYADAIEQLRAVGALYACGCSRREIADSSVRGIDGLIYPGTCRAGLPPGRDARALRVRTEGPRVAFDDRWQGRIECDLAREIGDFVVRRADGLIAYQLAVVVDDAAQGITEVVRGADLLYSTPRQLHLQRLLGLPPPRYAHLPVVVNAHGEKLSKQTGAEAVSHAPVVPLLRRVLLFLGQDAPEELELADVESFWRYAIAHWRAERVPARRAAPVPA